MGASPCVGAISGTPENDLLEDWSGLVDGNISFGEAPLLILM